MTDEVNDLLNALNDGSLTVDEVAARFRSRSWPRRDPAPTTTYAEIATAELQDPDPYTPGSFDDVTAAYHRGDLSEEQYDILAAAMAESIEAEDVEDLGRG
jgi:hypothetical protein